MTRSEVTITSRTEVSLNNTAFGAIRKKDKSCCGPIKKGAGPINRSQQCSLSSQCVKQFRQRFSSSCVFWRRLYIYLQGESLVVFLVGKFSLKSNFKKKKKKNLIPRFDGDNSILCRSSRLYPYGNWKRFFCLTIASLMAIFDCQFELDWSYGQFIY